MEWKWIMGIEDFKRWHWIVIGVVVGGILAYTRIQMSPDESSVYRRGISATEFIRDLQRAKTPNGYAWLVDVTIYPPIEKKTYVTGRQLEIQPNGKGTYKPFQLIADIPFKMIGAPPPPRQDYTIRQYIDQLAAGHAEVKYRFAWWDLPMSIAGIWGGGALLVVGGVWPTIVNLMIGAGLGRKKENHPDYDLERFKGAPEPLSVAAKKVTTAADQAKLQALQDQLQANLAASAASADQPAVNAPGAPVRKLEAGPLELTAAQKKEKEDREYKGEYYPVARPAGHTEEAKS